MSFTVKKAITIQKNNVLGSRWGGTPQGQKNGYCYVTVGVDLDGSMNTIYFVKIGKGRYPVDRCNHQRLKLIGYSHNGKWRGKSLEDHLLAKAKGTYSTPIFGYKPAGYTEMVGSFSSVEKAVIIANEILNEIETLKDRQVFRFTEEPVNNNRNGGWV